MVITILAVLISFALGFFVAIKSVQLGLRWQIQTSHKQEPSIRNPVREAIQTARADGVDQYSKDQIAEWINGEAHK